MSGPGLRRLDCPNCGGSVDIRANGISVTAICGSCGAALDVASEEVRVIAEARQRTREPALPIGQRGVLSGTEWEVIGYQLRSNPKEGWSWEEYLLFNPYRGFRFLSADDEGWTLYCMLRQDVPATTAKVKGDGHSYGRPEASEARTDYVLGEFYWRVRVGDVVSVEERRAGNWRLVCESGGGEIIWSRGLHLNPEVVRKAFGIGPSKAELAAVERRQKRRAVLRVAALAVLLLVLLSCFDLDRYGDREVFVETERASAATRGVPIASQPFTVPDPGGNLEIAVAVPLQNSWADVGVSLAPDGGGPSYDGLVSLEYYTGVDSDGSWTEGSSDGSVLFRNIPGGTYRILFDIDSGAFSTGGSVPLGVTVRRHVPAREFFWFALLLLVPYPLFYYLYSRARG